MRKVDIPRSLLAHAQGRTSSAPRRGVRPERLVWIADPVVDAITLVAATAVFGHGRGLGIAYGVAAFLMLVPAGARRTRINPTLEPELPALLGRLAVAFVLVAGVPLLLGRIPSAALADAAGAALAALVLVPSGRALAYAMLRFARARGHLSERALIVGPAAAGHQVARVLQEHPEYGLVFVGFVEPLAGGDGLAMPILGDTRALAPTVERTQVTAVIVALGAMSDEELADVLRTCDTLPVEVYVVPRFFQLGVALDSSAVGDVWGIPLAWLRRPGRRRTARMIKRCFDVVVASAGLLLCAPVLLAVALAVRCSSPGPVLFRQVRIGQDERPFQLLKFRTMLVNGDADTTWSVADDARVTRIGRFLRRSCLDELPQLFNVLRGDMSLVGPRPERPHFARRFAREVPRYDDRHRVPGGMTGWAQVHGLRGDTPIPDRARFDNYYIEHWSLWRDVVIVVRTLVNVLLGR